jgi:hypothetical protein
MAIKGGQIIHAGNGVAVIDRIQTAGPGQLNIPTEKIYELGNYKSVATDPRHPRPRVHVGVVRRVAGVRGPALGRLRRPVRRRRRHHQRQTRT